MPRDMTDQEHLMRAMVDHPAGTRAPGRHRKPEPEVTPADTLEHNRAWNIAQAVMCGVAVLGGILLVLLVLTQIFRTVMGL